jgi:hypothetical protein
MRLILSPAATPQTTLADPHDMQVDAQVATSAAPNQTFAPHQHTCSHTSGNSILLPAAPASPEPLLLLLPAATGSSSPSGLLYQHAGLAKHMLLLLLLLWGSDAAAAAAWWDVCCVCCTAPPKGRRICSKLKKRRKRNAAVHTNDGRGSWEHRQSAAAANLQPWQPLCLPSVVVAPLTQQALQRPHRHTVRCSSVSAAQAAPQPAGLPVAATKFTC